MARTSTKGKETSGRKSRGNKEEIKGVNSCILGGVIEHYYPSKYEKSPDMIVLKIPYGEYGTNVSVYVWTDSDAYKAIEENDIDEGMLVVTECEVLCSKKVDYKPQFYVKTIEKLGE